MADFMDVMRQYKRMCKESKGCDRCPYGKFMREKHISEPCTISIAYHPEIFEDFVLNWAAEHPEKTLRNVLLEKFPDARLDIDGKPLACPYALGISSCWLDKDHTNCDGCWDQAAPKKYQTE